MSRRSSHESGFAPQWFPPRNPVLSLLFSLIFPPLICFRESFLQIPKRKSIQTCCSHHFSRSSQRRNTQIFVVATFPLLSFSPQSRKRARRENRRAQLFTARLTRRTFSNRCCRR